MYRATNKINIVYFILLILGLFYSISIRAEIIRVPYVSDTTKLTADFNTTAWSKAIVFSEFATLNGDVPSVKTKLYLMYNKNNLYVGFECFDQDPNELVINSRYPPEEDSVGFALDSFNDGLASYVFLSDPSGERLNAVFSDDSPGLRFSFATEYTTISKRTLHGYNVVLIIPFKSFPYSWQPRTLMSFRAVRYIHQNEEIDSFPYIMEDRKGEMFFHYQQIQLDNISQTDFKKPWFDIDTLFQNRKRLAAGYDLNTLKGRASGWGISSVVDYKMLPSHLLDPSKNPKPLQKNLKTKWIEQLFNSINFYPNQKINNLDHFLERTQTTSFIIVHNDKIIYEKYFNGFNQSSFAASFSMAKSFLSALIGIAVDKKQICSIEDPITNYLPELFKRDRRFARIRIKDLLSMSAGIRVSKDSPYDDATKAYWSPNLKYILLDTLEVLEAPGRHFLYHDYVAQLAGLILIRATQRNATQLLQNGLWDPLGMQYGGSWTIDSEKDALEQLAFGISATALDYAKFGLLFLHEGKWNNKQIISASWVKESTQPTKEQKELGYYPSSWLDQEYYKYYWRGLKRASKNNDKNDFFAIGHLGQFIYISPQKNLVIVRTGMDSGIKLIYWTDLFYDFASKF